MGTKGLLGEVVDFISGDGFRKLEIVVEARDWGDKTTTAVITARCGEEGVTYRGRADRLLAMLQRTMREATVLGGWTDRKEVEDD